MLNIAFVMVDENCPSNVVMYILEVEKEAFDYINNMHLEDYNSVRKYAEIDPYDGEEIVCGEISKFEIDAWVTVTM